MDPPHSILKALQGRPEMKDSCSGGEHETSSINLMVCGLFSLDELLITNDFKLLSSFCSKEVATSVMSGSQKHPLIVRSKRMF